MDEKYKKNRKQNFSMFPYRLISGQPSGYQSKTFEMDKHRGYHQR